MCTSIPKPNCIKCPSCLPSLPSFGKLTKLGTYVADKVYSIALCLLRPFQAMGNFASRNPSIGWKITLILALTGTALAIYKYKYGKPPQEDKLTKQGCFLLTDVVGYKINKLLKDIEKLHNLNDNISKNKEKVTKKKIKNLSKKASRISDLITNQAASIEIATLDPLENVMTKACMVTLKLRIKDLKTQANGRGF